MEKRENGKWRKPRKYKLLQKLLDANEYVAPIKQANPYTTNKPPEDVLVTIQTTPGDVFDLKLELDKAKARKGKKKVTQVPVKENLMHGKRCSGMVMSNMSGTDTAHTLHFPPQMIDPNLITASMTHAGETIPAGNQQLVARTITRTDVHRVMHACLSTTDLRDYLQIFCAT